MASRRTARDWDAAQARDLRTLPDVARVVRPGAYGTFPERVQGSAPKSPTLDNDALYTGEWREEVNGSDTVVTPVRTATVEIAGGAPYSILATLRRPWPWVGFAIDVSKVATGTHILAGLRVVMRSGRAILVANASGSTLVNPTIAWTVPGAPASPNDWIAMTGIFVGARVELWVQVDGEGSPTMRGNLWGYNAPGYGP